MIVSATGEAKTGKTTFAYTAPKKVVGFSWDIGAERALYGVKFDFFKDYSIHIERWTPPTNKPSNGTKFRDEILERRHWDINDITIYEMPPPVQLTDKVVGVREQWQAFLTLYQTAVQDADVRSIVIDTGSLARRAAADSWLQTLQEDEPAKQRKNLTQIEWAKPNNAIRDIYNLARATDKNLIMVHHLKDERKAFQQPNGMMENLPTGKRILDGLTDSERIWDVGVRTEKSSKGVITFKYDVCGYNLGLENGIMAGETWDSMVTQIDGSLGGRLKLERTSK